MILSLLLLTLISLASTEKTAGIQEDSPIMEMTEEAFADIAGDVKFDAAEVPDMEIDLSEVHPAPQ